MAGNVQPSSLPFMQWLAERFAFGEDIIVAENTQKFDWPHFASIVEAEWDFSVLQVSPTLLGEPVERRRLYMTLLRKGQRRWQSCAQNRRALFEELFARRVLLCPEDKFRASSVEVQEYITALADAQNLPEFTKSGKAWSCYQAMSSACRAKVDQHRGGWKRSGEQKRRQAPMPVCGPQT